MATHRRGIGILGSCKASHGQIREDVDHWWRLYPFSLFIKRILWSRSWKNGIHPSFLLFVNAKLNSRSE
jgi:hypothetical protein